MDLESPRDRGKILGQDPVGEDRNPGGREIKTVVNKTVGPIKLSLPRGKTLHLGPGGSGQVHDDALERPSVKKLIKAGKIEVLGEGGQSATGERTSARIHESTHGHRQPKVVTPKGNR